MLVSGSRSGFVLCLPEQSAPLAAVLWVGEDDPDCHNDQRRSPGGGQNTPAFQRARQSPLLQAIPGRVCPAQSIKKRLSLHWATEQKRQPFLLHSVNPSADGVRSRMVLHQPRLQPRLQPGIVLATAIIICFPAPPALQLLYWRASASRSLSHRAAYVACLPRNVLW